MGGQEEFDSFTFPFLCSGLTELHPEFISLAAKAVETDLNFKCTNQFISLQYMQPDRENWGILEEN